MKAMLGLMVGGVALMATVLWAAETLPATKPASQPATGSQPATKAATQGALEAIKYSRTGGFVGTNDGMEISPAGAVTVQGKLLGNAKGQLTPEQSAKLAGLFADWKSLKASYPAPRGSADGFQITISYGTVSVSASDMNAALPASFKAAQSELEKIAQEMKGK